MEYRPVGPLDARPGGAGGEAEGQGRRPEGADGRRGLNRHDAARGKADFRRLRSVCGVRARVDPGTDHGHARARTRARGTPVAIGQENLTSPRIPRTASLGYRRKGAEPWLLMVASPSGSTADVADLAFDRACPWLDRGGGTPARGVALALN